MKNIVTTVYNFNELDEKAKEKARDWYRVGGLDYEWWDSTYEDAKTIGLEIDGFDLDRNRHATGKLLQGAHSVAELILKNHGPKCETHHLATALIKAWKTADDEARETLTENFEKDLLEEYSQLLQSESEYLMSNEAIDDTIEANEYTFTKDGKRFG